MANTKPVCIRVPIGARADIEALRSDLEAKRLATGGLGRPYTITDVLLAAALAGIPELRRREGL